MAKIQSIGKVSLTALNAGLKAIEDLVMARFVRTLTPGCRILHIDVNNNLHSTSHSGPLVDGHSAFQLLRDEGELDVGVLR
jgi:hypothetical protein